MNAPANMKQHPLSAAIPRLTAEEVTSLIDCEGVVLLSKEEIKAATSLDWFKSLSKSRRAMFVVSVFDWLAKGSNQYVKKIHTKSPRHQARITQQAIARAAA